MDIYQGKGKTPMKTDCSKIISLYKRLLDITEKEQNEIANFNIDNIENCWSLKEYIIRELEKMNHGKPWNAGSHMDDEIVTIIKKIIAVNKINADKVREMKDELLKNISTLHNSTKAVRAYQTSSY